MHQVPPERIPPEPTLFADARAATNWLIGKDGLRAGWRLLLYVLMVVVTGAVVSLGIHFLHGASGQKAVAGPPSSVAMLEQEVLAFAVIFGAALLMSRIEKRPPSQYGLPAKGFLGGKFWTGFFVGIFEVCLLVGLIKSFGGYSFGSLALSGSDIIRWGAFYLLLFLFVGLFEEFLFRGYAQFTLGQGIGFWPAAVLLSVGFGAVHLGNPGEGVVGAASIIVVAMLFCFSLRRTGNLWFAVGLHASFDWGETYLFSVPNSGLVMQGHLSNSLLHGAKWLTGGTIGPEGSIFCFLTMGLQFLVVALLFPAKKVPGEGANLVV